LEIFFVVSSAIFPLEVFNYSLLLSNEVLQIIKKSITKFFSNSDMGNENRLNATISCFKTLQ